jgi:choline dehydrogenase-like flavoprotein
MPDYVIVGGGSAGCVMAARLSGMSDASVLLLEAGPSDTDRLIHLPVGFYKMTDGPLTWGFRTAPLAHADGREMTFPQGRCSAAAARSTPWSTPGATPPTYDAWAEEEGCAGWAYADVPPYSRKAEDNERFSNAWHGTGGRSVFPTSEALTPLTSAFVRAAQEARHPLQPRLQRQGPAGCGLYQGDASGTAGAARPPSAI